MLEATVGAVGKIFKRSIMAGIAEGKRFPVDSVKRYWYLLKERLFSMEHMMSFFRITIKKYYELCNVQALLKKFLKNKLGNPGNFKDFLRSYRYN